MPLEAEGLSGRHFHGCFKHWEECGIHWCLFADATPLPSLRRLTLMVGPTPQKSRALFHAWLKRVLNLQSSVLIFYPCLCSFTERALASAHRSLQLQRELMRVWQQWHPFHKGVDLWIACTEVRAVNCKKKKKNSMQIQDLIPLKAHLKNGAFLNLCFFSGVICGKSQQLL